jgi:hypothetical protein
MSPLHVAVAQVRDEMVTLGFSSIKHFAEGSIGDLT